MSWGYKILIVYILFIGMILGMVYVASRQTNEMQDDNYYAKELVYQSVIDGKNNLNALTEKLVVENTSDAVQIKFRHRQPPILQTVPYIFCVHPTKKLI
jgi:hypothetical protein